MKITKMRRRIVQSIIITPLLLLFFTPSINWDMFSNEDKTAHVSAIGNDTEQTLDIVTHEPYHLTAQTMRLSNELSPYEYNSKNNVYTQIEISTVHQTNIQEEELQENNINEIESLSIDIADSNKQPLFDKLEAHQMMLNDFNEFASLATDIIFSVETNYSYGGEVDNTHYMAINGNDNGSLSIGKIQWHGYRAKNLLLEIQKEDPKLFDRIINNNNAHDLKKDLFNEKYSWNSYKLYKGTNSYNAVSELLGTTAGINVQNRIAVEDVKGYIKLGIEYYGIHNPEALIYFSDIANQYGEYSGTIKSIVKRSKNNGAPTLDSLFTATKNITSGYRERRESVYNTIKGINYVPDISDYIDNMILARN